jgi:integrase
MARHQKGSLRKRYGSWSVRYYDDAGQHSAILGRVDDYPRKSDILPVFEDFMRQVNDQMLGTTDPLIVPFVENVYLPSLRLAESTVAGYSDIWRVHVKGRVEGLALSQIKPSTVSRVLEQIAATGKSRTTVQHIKHFISGVFTHARQHGHYDNGNPVTGIKLPKAKAPVTTYAYSLDESQKMLDELSGMAKVAVAVAAYAGLDRGELQGLRWEDFRNGDLHVERKVWKSVIKEPKTDQRRAPVPVIDPLRKIIDEYRVQIGDPKEGWVFSASRGKLPMRMDNIARREIIPSLPDGIAWHGWHAFRRGLATNLRATGVPDDIITRILRHADIGTAQRFYSKTLDGNVRDAMDKFGKQAGK